MENFKPSRIVLEYLEKFPTTPTLTLAKLIYKENSECFISIENVRSVIRYYRGNKGDANRNKLVNRKFVREFTADLFNPFRLPESDEKEFEPFILPKEANRILLLGDIHIPYHSINAVTAAMRHGLDNGVNAILLNGDIWDNYQLSMFVKNPKNRHFPEERDLMNKFLDSLQETFSNCVIYYKIGNHEERIESYLRIKAPEIYGIPEFEIENLLDFEDRGIQVIKEKRTIQAGKLSIVHGHEIKGGIIPPVNPARGLFLRTGVQTICSHFHRTSQHTDPNLKGDLISCWSTGCLCELSPEYMPNNKWNHGAAIITLENEGEFNVDNFMIDKQKIFKA